MPHVSIIVPAYNTLSTLPDTLASLLAQTYTDFEIIIVDDGSSDGTAQWVLAQIDPRIRLERQLNRGLAGARNGGIAVAKGTLIGLCDGDDLWEPEKLAVHVQFLADHPDVGVSYSGSLLVDENNASLGITQTPKIDNVSARDILRRNPVGNGSAPVIRAATFKSIAYRPKGQSRDWYFDENFRQSEDIECWMRIALTTHWQFGGVATPLTRYRIVAGGLSANLERQFETWCAMADKVAQLDPDFAARWMPSARAYQLRYLARRAVSLGAGKTAAHLLWRSARSSLHPFLFEPAKSLLTLGATAIILLGGRSIVARVLRGARG